MGMGSLTAGVYANGNELTLKTAVELQGELAQSYSRIYNRRINPKFRRYLDSESLLGFFAYSIDTKAYLEELPKMVSKLYGPIIGSYGEELDLGADVLSLLVDEEAIANTVKGDALFVLNGLIEHEVTYTDYEYDDDYNVTEVEKTKTETIPDFLLMFSSDNETLYRRFMDYAVHKGVGTLDDGVYTVSHREIPVNLYVTCRNGIVFLGTGEQQVAKIASNSFGNRSSKFHRKLLKQNQLVGFVNTQNALKRFSEDQMETLASDFRIRQMFNHFGNFYFRSGKAKKNVFSGELVAQSPDEFTNSLEYLLWLVDYAAELD